MRYKYFDVLVKKEPKNIVKVCLCTDRVIIIEFY